MVDVRITLAGLWIVVMLTYLLGDVLRGFAGHVVPGEIQGKTVSQGTWVLIAAIMLVPIVMLGLPYEGAYDNFLIGASVVLCGLIAWYAWTWSTTMG